MDLWKFVYVKKDGKNKSNKGDYTQHILNHLPTRLYDTVTMNRISYSCNCVLIVARGIKDMDLSEKVVLAKCFFTIEAT